MTTMVGYCGIVCSDCPIFVVTQKNDDAGRKRVAEILDKQYRTESKSEDINCDGCLSESSCIYKYCSLCEIRKCARKKNIENCTQCPEYPCESLKRFSSKNTEDKKIWDEIRQEIMSDHKMN
jgi:hypothetical protein